MLDGVNSSAAHRRLIIVEDTDDEEDCEPEPCDVEEGEGTEHDLDGYDTQTSVPEEHGGSPHPFVPFINVSKEYEAVVVPSPTVHHVHETADALPTPASPPTSPEPTYNTPNHSPPEATILPCLLQSFQARRAQASLSSAQCFSSASPPPHPHNLPLISAPRLPSSPHHPSSDHDGYCPLSPIESSNIPNTRFNLLPTSLSSPTASSDALSNSRTESQPIELQPPHLQQDINVVPQRENIEHTGGESDRDDDGEDSEDAESNFDQAEFEGRKIKRYYFRVPKSSEECAVKFTSLQPVLKNFMNELYEEFFISLLVSCYGHDDDVLEIPHIYIGLPSGDTSFPSIDQFPRELRETDIGIVLCRVRTSWCSTANPSRKLPFQNLRTGISVGLGERNSTTLGVMVKKPNGRYVGITSGHLLDKKSVGTDITQPGLLEFSLQLETLRQTSARWQHEIDFAPDSEQRDLSTIEKEKVDIAIAEAEKFVGNSPAETAAKIKAGTIIQREFKTVQLEDRRCISDFLIFGIEEARQPVKVERWSFMPLDTGELSKGEWRLLRDWGQISLDDQVRKNGAVTGITFGFVAGVKASWKSPAFKTVVDEYYVLEEADVRNNRFSAGGDSGAALVSKEGKLVGFIMAQATVEDFEVVVHPKTGMPDLKAMKLNREDGGLHMEKVWFESFPEVVLTMVMCASVLEKRAGIQEMGTLYLDS